MGSAQMSTGRSTVRDPISTSIGRRHCQADHARAPAIVASSSAVANLGRSTNVKSAVMRPAAPARGRGRRRGTGERERCLAGKRPHVTSHRSHEQEAHRQQTETRRQRGRRRRRRELPLERVEDLLEIGHPVRGHVYHGAAAGDIASHERSYGVPDNTQVRFETSSVAPLRIADLRSARLPHSTAFSSVVGAACRMKGLRRSFASDATEDVPQMAHPAIVEQEHGIGLDRWHHRRRR